MYHLQHKREINLEIYIRCCLQSRSKCIHKKNSRTIFHGTSSKNNLFVLHIYFIYISILHIYFIYIYDLPGAYQRSALLFSRLSPGRVTLEEREEETKKNEKKNRVNEETEQRLKYTGAVTHGTHEFLQKTKVSKSFPSRVYARRARICMHACTHAVRNENQ